MPKAEPYKIAINEGDASCISAMELSEAIAYAKTLDDVVFVVGSFYVYGDVVRLLEEK